MSVKTGKKIGFIAALAMLVGSVVGIGIFFKNGSVIRASGDNATTVLLSWIIGGLLALFAAISFSEIGTLKTKNVHGLSAWAEQVAGKKIGYFTRFNFTVFYFSLLVSIFGFFVSELLFLFLNTAGAIDTIPHSWVHLIVGLGFGIFTAALNYFSLIASGWVQTITAGLKLIPLVLALVVGLIFANTHNAGGSNHFKNGTSFSFTGLLAALPAVLFAYDAFLNVAALSEKTKGGTKTVSKVVLFGIIGVIVLYTLIAVSALLHNGSINGIITDALSAKSQKGLNIFVFLFLFISGYGVQNGMTAAGVASFDQSVLTNTFFGVEKVKAKFGLRKTSIIYFSIFFIFWTLVGVLPAAILQKDAYVDTVSNFSTLFFFGIYALTIALYTLKREAFQTKQISKWFFLISAWVGVAGILFVLVYQLSYGFTIQHFLEPNKDTSAGLFAGEDSLNGISTFGIFISFLGLFFILPIANAFFKSKFEKTEWAIDTQSKEFE